MFPHPVNPRLNVMLRGFRHRHTVFAVGELGTV